jgi:hypothetical protein
MESLAFVGVLAFTRISRAFESLLAGNGWGLLRVIKRSKGVSLNHVRRFDSLARTEFNFV